MDTKLISKLQKSVQQAKASGGRRVRYPESVKESVRKLVGLGASRGQVANLIGVGEPTVFKWCRSDGESFRSVKVRSSESQSTANLIVVILPSGIRIECANSTLLREVLESVA
jgi:hypothetical protein